MSNAKHRPAPGHGLKPLVITGNSTRGASPATPNLNAKKAAKARNEKANTKPANYVSAEEIRHLKPGHPARIAYTMAAHQGMAAAQAAFHAAMQQLKAA